jgi:tetratricopeptide (TPR) repeat protein
MNPSAYGTVDQVNENLDEVGRLQRALFAAKRANDTRAEVRCLLAIAEVGERGGDFGLTNLHLALASKVIRRSGQGLDQLHDVLGRRALLLRRARRYDEALALYEEAETAASEHNEPVEKC